eukprot:TRINITY_DN22111_c0_g2_i1.p1 TRINITY_DN22111_c0_g2~~TRINITY_DN22111_c0_g2_i1.p1  ORF type:complete len:231 (+),score=25.87 TRINITY_DN22111_c0_g2_i1:23-694(+)
MYHVNLGLGFFQDVCAAYDLQYEELAPVFLQLRQDIMNDPEEIFCPPQKFLEYDRPLHGCKQQKLLDTIQRHIRSIIIPSSRPPADPQSPNEGSSLPSIPSTPTTEGWLRLCTCLHDHNHNMRPHWRKLLQPLQEGGIILGGRITKQACTVWDQLPVLVHYTYILILHVATSADQERVVAFFVTHGIHPQFWNIKGIAQGTCAPVDFPPAKRLPGDAASDTEL